MLVSHYDDIIMGAIASLITSLAIVYSTVYSPHKWPVTRKMFPFDDVIMLSNETIPDLAQPHLQSFLPIHRWNWSSTSRCYWSLQTFCCQYCDRWAGMISKYQASTTMFLGYIELTSIETQYPKPPNVYRGRCVWSLFWGKFARSHCSDDIWAVWEPWRLKSPAIWLFVQ